MSQPLYTAKPSQRLEDLLDKDAPKVPTYQEVGALWNMFKTSSEAPTLYEFGQWLTGTGAYEGQQCQVTW